MTDAGAAEGAHSQLSQVHQTPQEETIETYKKPCFSEAAKY